LAYIRRSNVPGGLQGRRRRFLQERIQEAVKHVAEGAYENGYLTETQFQQIVSLVEQGQPSPFGQVSVWAARIHGNVDAVYNAVATRLGMSVQDLQSLLASGKPMGEIALEKGVTEKELRLTAASGIKPRLDEAVKSGQMTPKLAEAIVHRIEEAAVTDKAA
jgi:hypothetical protein